MRPSVKATNGKEGLIMDRILSYGLCSTKSR
uniref:Uncharacterized protein n=1 Tax=Anguilla anguilla TaxID=7936 RepID=A0A0E9V210_ANGAN